MSLKDLKKLKQPSGCPVSLAISQHGDLYAGWSSGAIMMLPRDSRTLQVYVKGSTTPSSTVKQRTPRSEFGSVNPIAIDAWGSNHSQYIGDGYLSRVFEISDDFVTVVAGTGATGRKDGDGLTEATFEAIRSIAVLPKYIAVLSKYSTRSAIRLIDRTTNRVTTLTEPPYFNNMHNAFQLLNTSQLTNPSVVCTAARWSTQVWPTAPDIQHSEDFKICIFRSATKTIEAGRTVPIALLTLTSSLDDSPLAPAALDSTYIGNILPVYCPLADSLFAVREGVISYFRNVLGRKEVQFPSSIAFSDVSNLLAPSGLTPDLEITHDASKTTFRLFRSIIDCNMYGKSTSTSSERLAHFVRSSKLPIATITLLIERLYFKSLKTVDSQQLITLAWILKEVFGKEDPIVIKALQDRIKIQSDKVVFDLLISAWANFLGPFELDETSLIIATMLPRVQNNRLDFKLAIDAAIAKHASNLQQVLSRMTSLLLLVAGPPLVAEFPRIPLFDLQPLSPIMVNSNSYHFLSVCSTNFVIQLPGNYAVGVCGWLLYAHWPWFKGLIDSGLQESKTRIIILPHQSFEASALKAVVTMLQFGQMESLRSLPLSDAISILEHASEFQLVALNGKPLPRIAPLLRACEAKAFPPLAADNCWSQLRLAHSIGSPKYSDIIQFIIETIKTLTMDELASLPEELSVELIRKLKARQKASSQPTNGRR